MDRRAPAFLDAFEPREIAMADGLTLHVRDYAPLAPVTGAPVLCLHGLTRNAKDFEIVAPRIAALGRRVIAPDMRGRGLSAYDPDPAHYVPAVYAQDVLALMDKLEIPQAVFIGTSMGALIAMLVAALAAERVAGAVLNDIGPIIDPAGLKRIGAYVGRGQPMASWEEAREGLRALAGDAYPDKSEDMAFWDRFARRSFRAREDGAIEADYDANIALTFADPETSPPPDLTPLFQHLAAKPVLSIRGELSDILSAEGVAHMRAVKPDLAAVEVPRVGHAPMLDEPPAWEAILDFLARVA